MVDIYETTIPRCSYDTPILATLVTLFWLQDDSEPFSDMDGMRQQFLAEAGGLA